MLTGLIVGLVMVAVLFAVAATRKASWALTSRPSRVSSFEAPLRPADVVKAVAGGAPLAGYKVDLVDEAGGRIVLGDAGSLIYFGFFYPIVVTARGDGAFVEVGVKPRVPQFGPVVTTKLTRCFDAVKAAVLAGA